MKKKSKFLAFNIRFPKELIPLYDFLQGELDFFLSDETSRKGLLAIDLSKHRGNVWRDMRDLFKDRVKTWPIRNKAWYSYILFENLRRELESKRERMLIWSTVKEHHKTIDSKLMNSLHEKGLYPTKMHLRNLIRANSAPELPKSATFNLDYTVSASSMFKIDCNNFCEIQTMGGTWLDYQIILPMSLNHNLTGEIAKPRFFKKKGSSQYQGMCSYKYEVEENSSENILGVDLGKIKYFSAVALDKTSGTYSDEFIESKRAKKVLNRLDRLYTEKTNLNKKIEHADAYGVSTDKNERRKENLIGLGKKISRVKNSLAKQAASEMVALAKQLDCKEIHVENLSWLESTGGKWNFSELQDKLKSKAEQRGIKFVKVSAWNSSKMNPVTGEIGSVNTRTVTFEDNTEIDRDVLAGINLALRTKNSINGRLPKLKEAHRKSLRVNKQSRRKEILELVKRIKRDMQIVVFQPCQVSSKSKKDETTWCPIYMDLPNTSLILSQSNKLKYNL